jgi:putative regulator of septum formation
MAAPAGVGGGSVPEPVVSDPIVTEPVALKPVAAEADAAEAVEGEADAAEAVEGEAGGTEGLAGGLAVPELAGPGAGESEGAGGRRGVSWLMVTGVVAVLVAAVAAAGALVVTTHGFRHKTVVTYRPAAVFSLRAGDCINSSQNGLSVTILSCATRHDAEVFATFSLTGSSWPGEAAVQQRANRGCTNRLAGYLNPQLLNAGLTQQYVYPNQDAWKAGVHTVICEVSSGSGPLSGSVRNNG